MNCNPVAIVGMGGLAKSILSEFDLDFTRNLVLILKEAVAQKSLEIICKKVVSEDTFLVNNDKSYKIINAVGARPHMRNRELIHEKFKNNNFKFLNSLSKHASIAGDVKFGEDVHVLPGAVINAGTNIGDGTVISSGSILEHDCNIGQHIHIAPGAVLCGEVEIGHGSYIGPGAVIGRGVTLGCNVIIGANSTVLSHVPATEKIYGVYYDKV